MSMDMILADYPGRSQFDVIRLRQPKGYKGDSVQHRFQENSMMTHLQALLDC